MPRTNADSRILIFAKAPQPGAVKTRLIARLGADGAAALHARLVKHALATAQAAAVGPVELWCAPDIEDPFARACASQYGVALVCQPHGDLGARMLQAFGQTLACAQQAILIGTDCPALTARHLQRAHRALATGHDAVLVPAEDGGYVLIGLRRCDARLFNAISWGTARVMATTRAKLRTLGWRWCELDTLWDVDRPDDYQRLLDTRLLDHDGAHV